jgi:hypothetical protein
LFDGYRETMENIMETIDANDSDQQTNIPHHCL